MIKKRKKFLFNLALTLTAMKIILELTLFRIKILRIAVVLTKIGILITI